jgi:hypothetical protein
VRTSSVCEYATLAEHPREPLANALSHIINWSIYGNLYCSTIGHLYTLDLFTCYSIKSQYKAACSPFVQGTLPKGLPHFCTIIHLCWFCARDIAWKHALLLLINLPQWFCTNQIACRLTIISPELLPINANEEWLTTLQNFRVLRVGLGGKPSKVFP